jgi:hypothetical protein
MKHLFLKIISSTALSLSAFGAVLGAQPSSNSLIVYNGGIALVHEQRALSTQKSDGSIIYEGVANTIEIDSVNVKLDDSITLYSQQYRFDKLTQKKLLEAHIGKEVEVRVMKDSKNFQILKATLLSNDGNLCIVQTDSNEIISVNSNNIIFKTIPNELITKPSLVWNISAKKDLKAEMELDYLIKNVDWQSNYILDVKDESANLSGWISIDNRSGKKFENTELYVLAGDINRAQRAQNRYMQVRKTMAMDAMAEEVKHQAHEGYHFYTIPFKVNLADNEKTQIKFIDKKNIKITRKYTAQLSNPLYMQGEQKHDVSQYIHSNGFDFPMPKGVVRSYSKVKGTSLLLGESNLNHTPKKTPIDLKLGNNFDLSTTETVLQRDDNKNYIEVTAKYSIKNSSDSTKTIELLIPFNKSTTSSIDSTKPYKYTKGNLVTFEVQVKNEGTETFKVKFRAKK